MQQNTGISDVLHDFNNSKKKNWGWMAGLLHFIELLK